MREGLTTAFRGKPAVFLDRDGTINVEAGYIRDLSDLCLIPGSGEAIRHLNELNIPVFLATNQTGPARGYYTEEWVLQLNDRVGELLLDEGALLDDMYYCPHLPEGTVEPYNIACNCRKPAPGMLLQAAKDYGVDLSRSYMVGDKASDVEVAHNTGAKGILLRTGYGEQVLAGEYQQVPDADYIADDLADAVDWILRDIEKHR